MSHSTARGHIAMGSLQVEAPVHTCWSNSSLETTFQHEMAGVASDNVLINWALM